MVLLFGFGPLLLLGIYGRAAVDPVASAAGTLASVVSSLARNDVSRLGHLLLRGFCRACACFLL